MRWVGMGWDGMGMGMGMGWDEMGLDVVEMRTGHDTPQPTIPHPTTFGVPPYSPVLELLEMGRSSPVLTSVLMSPPPSPLFSPGGRRLWRGSQRGVWQMQLSSCGTNPARLLRGEPRGCSRGAHMKRPAPERAAGTTEGAEGRWPCRRCR